MIEIGAVAGGYTHAVTQQENPVDAVEPIAHTIEIFKANSQPGEAFCSL